MMNNQAQPDVFIDPARTSILIHRNLGAQVLQAGLGNIAAIFYLSPLSVTAPYPGSAATPARGGMPLLFPQFADSGPLPKHGFVRTATWHLLADEMLPGSHRVSYGLDIAPDDYPTWPHAARLRLVVESTLDELVFELQINNTGEQPFNWTGGLHPYFSVQDILACNATGLAGLGVQDRYDANLLRQPSGELGWTEQAFERLYDACPPLVLDTGVYSLRLNARGFDQWMVWNPGAAGAHALADLPADDWRRFVCVEPVCVARPVMLAPGERFEGQLHIKMCDSKSSTERRSV